MCVWGGGGGTPCACSRSWLEKINTMQRGNDVCASTLSDCVGDVVANKAMVDDFECP